MRRRDPKLARTAARAAETARQARLSAIIREHGTQAEQVSLLFSALMTGVVKLTELADAAEGEPPVEFGPPEPEFLARLTCRVERRAKLKLPKAECAADPPAPYCDCLERALDQPGDEGRRAVLKLAGAFHKRTVREPVRPPAAPDLEESRLSSEEPTDGVEDLFPRPEPKPKAEPPVRVVHRVRRWYDGETQSFQGMTF